MTQQYRVEFAASAKAEVHDAYIFIRERSPLNAHRWREALLAAAESLSTMPTRGRLAPESDAFPLVLHGFPGDASMIARAVFAPKERRTVATGGACAAGETRGG